MTDYQEEGRIEEGYQILQPTAKLGWKAAYGVYLIQLVRDADEEEERTGVFTPISPMSEEEFREMRKRVNKAKLFKGSKNGKENLS